jgi:trimeric autotransporter adhesin
VHKPASNNIAIGLQAGANLTNSSFNIDIGNTGSSNESGVIRIGQSGLQTSTYIAGISGVNASTGQSVFITSDGMLGTMTSSRRYKEDIHDMGSASDGLMRLRPVSFRYKKAFDDGSKPIQYGLIAEEVAEVYPDLVAKNADGQVEAVKYQLLDSMLLNELQKQNAVIAAQKEQIRSLEEHLARVEAALGAAPVTAAAR